MQWERADVFRWGAFWVALLCAGTMWPGGPLGAAEVARDLGALAKDRSQWPDEVRAIEGIEATLSMENGKCVGKMKLAEGKVYPLVGIEGGNVLLGMGGMVAKAPADKTDLWQQVDEWAQRKAAEAAVATAAPDAAAGAGPAGGGTPQSLDSDTAKLDVGLGEKAALKESGIGREQRYLEFVASRTVSAKTGTPAAFSGLPEIGEPRYFVVRLGGLDVPLVMDVAKMSRSKLFVDVDGDGNFSGAVALTADNRYSGSTAEKYGSYEFGEVKVGEVAVKIAGRHYLSSSGGSQSSLGVTPVSYREGRVKLGGETFTVGLVDGDGDGKLKAGYTDDMAERRSDGSAGYDLLAVDLNGDKVFDYRNEIYPLTPMVGVRDKYYAVTIAGDKSSAEFGPVRSLGLGDFSAGSPQMEVTLVSEGCCHHLEANATGTWQLPEGNYRVAFHRLVDAKGGAWALNGDRGSFRDRVRVKTGGAEKMALGCPVQPKFDINWSGETAHIGFEMVGVAGEEYDAGATKNGNREKAPSFKIYDRDGKMIESGNFEYG